MADTNDRPEVERPKTRAGLPVPGDAISSPEVVASRRGFIRSGLAAGSIVLSVVNRPAWAKTTEKNGGEAQGGNAQEGNGQAGNGGRQDGLTESAAASSTHLSHHPRGT